VHLFQLREVSAVSQSKITKKLKNKEFYIQPKCTLSKCLIMKRFLKVGGGVKV
jgi:hypothetical protein